MIGLPVHKAPEETIVTDAGNAPVTVIVIVLLVAGTGVAQVALDVSSAFTRSPFARVVVVYVGPVKTDPPLTNHSYTGPAPPLVGVGVNVTEVPEQIEPDGTAAIVTEAARLGFTVIVIALLVAGLPVTHNAFDVSMQVTIWPFVKVEVVYVGLLIPTLPPFTCH